MDLQLRILGEDQASAAFSSMASSARAGLQVLVDFTKESVKAYAESERVQRQLQLVAKEYTSALQAQASAMAQTNATSDELVMQVQTMLLRYGEAPAAVGATTQAILDYAAATGADARTATELLTRGVESGTGAFKGLGVSISATGDKTRDLEAATKALTEKFGGASAEDAASLVGQTNAAKEAFGELQETFGGFVSEVASKSGALEGVTGLLRDMATAAGQLRDFVSAGGLDAAIASAKALITGEGVDEAQAQWRLAQSGYAQSQVAAQIDAQATAKKLAGATKGSGSSRVSRGAGVATSKSASPNASKLRESDFIDEGDDWIREAKAASAAFKKLVENHDRAMADEAKAAEAAFKKLVKNHDRAMADVQRITKESADKLKAEQKQFADAGLALGSAFGNSLVGAVEQLLGGGEQDIGKLVANVVASMLQGAGALVGNLLLPGLGGVIGGAVGGLAGAGVRALANVSINTFDQRSTREFFESDGGRGFYNAQRTGRGQRGG